MLKLKPQKAEIFSGGFDRFDSFNPGNIWNQSKADK